MRKINSSPLSFRQRPVVPRHGVRVDGGCGRHSRRRADGPDPASTEEIVYFARAVMFQISNVYALRMAGVFMISLGTIWLRTGGMPKWLAVVTYVAATTLLLTVTLSLWVMLVFQAWVLVVSLHILLRTFGRKPPRSKT